MKIELVKDGKLREMATRSLKGGRVPAYLAVYRSPGRRIAGGTPKELSHDPLTELLSEKISFLAESIPPRITVASLGVSDGEREYMVLKELGKKDCEYCAIDPRSSMLDTLMSRLKGLGVKWTSYVGFLEDLPKVRARISRPLLLCCLGNLFCSFEPAPFLLMLRENLTPGDLLLLDCRLVGQAEGAASAGTRMVPELGLSPDSFEYMSRTMAASTPAGQALVTRDFLKIQKDCTLTTDAAIHPLKKGEELELGMTYSYKFSQVTTLLKRSRLQIVRLFVSDAHDGLLVLARPLEEGFLQYAMMER